MKKNFTTTILLLFFLTNYFTSFSQLYPQWQKTLTPQTSTNKNSTFTCTDVANNFYVLTKEDGGNVLTKYDVHGDKQWTHADVFPYLQIVVDKSGNIYSDGSNNSGELTIEKIDKLGNTVWNTSIGVVGPATITGLAIDAKDNVYTGGIGCTTYIGGPNNFFAAKVDKNGIHKWTNSYDDNYEYPGSTGIDSAGNVYVSGQAGNYNQQNVGVIVKFATSDGNVLWTKEVYNINAYKFWGSGLSGTDAQGNTNFTCQFQDSITYYIKTALIRFDKTGLQTVYYIFDDGNNDVDAPAAIHVSSNGVYLCGTHMHNDANQITSWFIVKLNAAGSMLYNAYYAGNLVQYGAYNNPTQITEDTAGNALVGGIVADNSGWDNRIADFDNSGNVIGYISYNGAQLNSTLASIAENSKGAIFSCGQKLATLKGDINEFTAFNTAPSFRDSLYFKAGGAAYDVTTDAAGNVYMAGITTKNYASIVTVIKADKNGNIFWTGSHASTNGDNFQPVNIARDKQGNIIVGGYSLHNMGSYYIAKFSVFKFDQNGNFLWDAYAPTTSTVYAAMCVDNANNICLTGYGFDANHPELSYNVYTCKFNSDGSFAWERQYSSAGSNNDEGRCIAADGSDNIYVGGFVNQYYAYLSGQDMSLLKYNSNGDTVWTRSVTGLYGSSDEANAIAINGSNIYLAGALGKGAPNGVDATVWKYTTAGNLLGTYTYNDSLNYDDEAQAIVLDAAKNMYITGYDRRNNARADLNRQNILTAKFNADGSLAWKQSFDNGEDYSENGYRIALDGIGDVYVSGYASNYNCLLRYKAATGDSLAAAINIYGGGLASTKTAGDGKGNMYVTPEYSFTLEKYMESFATLIEATGSTTICNDGNVQLFVNYTNAAFTYQWYKNNVAISGATASVYSTNKPGNYYCIVNNGTATSKSNTIKITVNNCSAGLMAENNASSTSIVKAETNEQTSAKVFPNPASSFINIQLFHPHTSSYTCVVFDVQGRKVFEGTLASSLQLDVTKWASGLYFAKISNGLENINERFVVQH